MSDLQELGKLKRENKRLRALLSEAVSLLNRYKHLIAKGGETVPPARKASARRTKPKAGRARRARG